MSKMTKRIHVSFDMTCMADIERLYEDVCKGLAERVQRGKTLEPMEARILEAYLEGGLEAALEAVLKQGLRDAIKDMMKDSSGDELTLKPAPVAIRLIR